MTIEMKPGRYFAIGWFVPGDGMDYLGALYRDEGGPWVTIYRFRYYANTADSLDDEKSWVEAVSLAGTTEAEAVCVFDRVVQEGLLSTGFCPPGLKPRRTEYFSADVEANGKKLLAGPETRVVPTSPGGDA